MSIKSVISFTLALVLLASAVSFAGDSEQDIINKYLAKTEKAHVQKIGWLSFHYQYNRVNRGSDYNQMASTLSTQISGTDFQWIGNTNAFGLEFGTVFKQNFAWTIGGEFWSKAGTSYSGTFTYTPPSGIPTTVVDPKSEVSVWGITTGMQYYIKNAPQPGSALTKLALRTGLTAGYYVATWDLFDQYQNLNLSTATPESENIAYKGNSVGLSLNVGAEYPIKLWDMTLGMDANYLYLNFGNVAWYNVQDEEIVATWNGEEDGRVDLDMSGFRGKVELKRYFSW